MNHRSYHIVLVLLFGIALAWSAVRPASVRNWFLESVPAVAGIVVVLLLNHRVRWSRFSVGLLFLYFVLPLANAHYGVAHVPFGETIGRWFGTDRNLYDRMVHFAAGLLATYPLYELFRAWRETAGKLRFMMPPLVILSFSALYEISEWVSAALNPRAGITFTGSQGDLWDAPKDMALAFLGTVITMIVIIFTTRKTGSARRKG